MDRQRGGIVNWRARQFRREMSEATTDERFMEICRFSVAKHKNREKCEVCKLKYDCYTQW